MATKKKTGTRKTSSPRAKKSPAPKGKGKGKGKAPAAKAPARKKTAGRAPARKKAKLPVVPQQKAGPEENPQAKALAHRIGQLLVDKKGEEVVVLDVRGKTSYTDYIVVTSAETDRQVLAMADNVQVELKKGDAPVRAISTEGLETGRWVLLDYGEVVAHLFLTDMRSHYDFEGLWADAAREKLS
ncbi:ribosome silencing factor [Myxococcus sp. K15C18031901]|uniref:ribosome silencing factor n=1 Tax=Myxococcus dinghuensis TaxID=2906761 RepID=UPI0020A7CDD2|nr:ribosome silencing factor [Myxococcus dinghuensis]MCP3103548.1 ribosome silencing factor [Myxococcus dinghuensis]